MPVTVLSYSGSRTLFALYFFLRPFSRLQVLFHYLILLQASGRWCLTLTNQQMDVCQTHLNQLYCLQRQTSENSPAIKRKLIEKVKKRNVLFYDKQ
ncbi:hypothetical protein RhiirB3_82093 [Rhizophagus irregularis]|nr:hypothetical protein RhiirB3_82093 [Rhizophagus irregularis]